MDALDAVVHRWMRRLQRYKPEPFKEVFPEVDAETPAMKPAPTDDAAQAGDHDAASTGNAATGGPAPATTGPSRAHATGIQSNPWEDPVYRGFVDVLSGTAAPIPGSGAGSGGGAGSTYQSLMATETRVLDTVDRVVNDARFVDAIQADFFQQPLGTVLDRTVRSMLDVFVDLMRARSIEDAVRAFSVDDRPLYLGLAVMAAVLCTMVFA